MSLDKLGIRTVISITFAPLILLSAWQGGYIFFAVVTSIVLLALNEFYDLATQKVTYPVRFFGFGVAIASCYLFFINRAEYLWILLSVTFVLLLIFELFRNEVAPILNVATTFMGVFYVAILLGFLLLIRELPDGSTFHYLLGGKWVILIFLSIWVCDSAAYMLGARLGRHKLFERVSPNKTIEGAIFGFIFALLTAYVSWLIYLHEMRLLHVLVIGGLCGTLGQISDLVESLFKRDARVKDASNLIPGHGGILDRFDSEILVAPAVFFYLRFVVF